MFALRNIMQDQIISELLFLTRLRVKDITIVCYVTFAYFFFFFQGLHALSKAIRLWNRPWTFSIVDF